MVAPCLKSLLDAALGRTHVQGVKPNTDAPTAQSAVHNAASATRCVPAPEVGAADVGVVWGAGAGCDPDAGAAVAPAAEGTGADAEVPDPDGGEMSGDSAGNELELGAGAGAYPLGDRVSSMSAVMRTVPGRAARSRNSCMRMHR
jgi:hypothetical protein